MRRQPHAKLSLTNLEDRLTPTGWLDPDFGTSGIVDTGLVNSQGKLAMMPDGDILAYGLNSDSHPTLVRFNPDGTKDTAFGNNGTFSIDETLIISDLKVASNGDIFVTTGNFNPSSPDPKKIQIFRMNSSGQLYTTSNGQTYLQIDALYAFNDNSHVAVRPDGSFMVLNRETGAIKLYQANGESSSDLSFIDKLPGKTQNNMAQRLIALPDGKTLVISQHDDVLPSGERTNIAIVSRLTAAGELDTTYGTNGRATIPMPFSGGYFGEVDAIGLDAAGGLFLSQRASSYSQMSQLVQGQLRVLKLTAEGQLDTAFSSDGIAEVSTENAMNSSSNLISGGHLLPDGRIVLLGDNPSDNGYILKVLKADGTADTTVADGDWLKVKTPELQGDGRFGTALLPDGRIAVLTSGVGSKLALTVVDLTEPMPTEGEQPPFVPPVLPPILPVPVGGPAVSPPVFGEVVGRPTSLPVTLPIDKVITLPEELEKGYLQPAGTVGDFNRDGVVDVIRTAGPTVTVLDGVTGSVIIPTFAPFEASYTGELNTAVMGFLYGSETKLVIAPRDGGGPVVAIYNADGTEFTRFFGLEDKDFRGGLGIATGPMTSDPYDDLIVTAGQGGGPRVAIYSGGSLVEKEIRKVVP
ncbi:MAG: hypothetical protein ACRC8S_20950, partial [Fimbriiglobus sp.]